MADEMGRSSGKHLTGLIDDLCLPELFAEEDLWPASDEKKTPLLDSGEEISLVLDKNYAWFLLFQEMLVSSAAATAATAAAPPRADSSQRPHQPGCYCLTAASALPGTTSSADESLCKRTFCDICSEDKPLPEMFPNPSCGHIFCRECVIRHISINLQENIIPVKCLAAECGGTLEPEQCREIVPVDVFDRWGTALCEAMLLGWRRFYCPFRDCSAPLVYDGEEDVRASECPHCHRLFCAQCGVPWHAGVECEEFQRLGEDERGAQDLMLLNLAKTKDWKRCPTCRFYVERGEGCLHITCRCGVQFCYGCGSTWSNAHNSCHT